MSRQNKVNRNNYTQRGRLTPDDMARERMNQRRMTARAKGKENLTAKVRSPGERGSSRSRSARGERD
jgi:hypothetical protein